MSKPVTIEQAAAAYAELQRMDRAAFMERAAGRSGLFCHEGSDALWAQVEAVWAAGYGFSDGKVAPLQLEA